MGQFDLNSINPSLPDCYDKSSQIVKNRKILYCVIYNIEFLRIIIPIFKSTSFLFTKHLKKIMRSWIIYILVWLRNWLISNRLEPVLNHTIRSCLASYYRQYNSTNINTKTKILIHVFLARDFKYKWKAVYNTMRQLSGPELNL